MMPPCWQSHGWQIRADALSLSHCLASITSTEKRKKRGQHVGMWARTDNAVFQEAGSRPQVSALADSHILTDSTPAAERAWLSILLSSYFSAVLYFLSFAFSAIINYTFLKLTFLKDNRCYFLWRGWDVSPKTTSRGKIRFRRNST